MTLRNYHTHTRYCDGKDSIEEMILAAIEQGFETLGFSGHSPLFTEDWCMTENDMQKYFSKPQEFKEKYKDKIEILAGLELDILSDKPSLPFDYIIGSVHALPVEGGLIPVDESLDILKSGIDKYFNGDALLFAEKYFERVSEVYDKTGCQIVGHLDLLTKYQEKEPLFDTAHKRYLDAAEKAIEKLASQSVIFEVNTGAIARGYRTTPYPEKSLLELIRAKGGRVMLNSDCHDKNYLTCGFSEALELIKNAGFEEIYYLNKGSLKAEKI